MNGVSFSLILVHGLILIFGLSFIVLGGMTLNPRLMLTDYPPEVQAHLPPMTAPEKKQQHIMGVFFFVFALGLLLYSDAQLIARSGEKSFLPLFVNTYLVFVVANLFDLMVLDYLILIVLKPKFLFVPGAEALEQYNTFTYHFKGFLKGMVYGIVLSLVVALVSIIIL